MRQKRGKPRAGLRVAYHDHVERRAQGTGKVLEQTMNGWFIETRRGGKWVAIMDLRFVRQRDANRAAQSLTAAGLDLYEALRDADPMAVKQIAVEFLQW